MITSGYGRSASDTPHPRTPAAQLQLDWDQRDVVASVRSRCRQRVHTTSPHRRCAQVPTPINFDDPDKFLLAFPAAPGHGPLLHAVWSSMAFDYVARQKISGTAMKYFLVKQLACPTPATFAEPTPWQRDSTLAEWVTPYVLELSYTSWRLQPYAREMGDEGPPFRWASERRSLLRADLDAAFLHIYGLTRSEAEHVLDSFPVVRKYDERDYGEYRTRRLVLESYDRMASAAVRGGAGWSPLADLPAGEGQRHPAASREMTRSLTD